MTERTMHDPPLSIPGPTTVPAVMPTPEPASGPAFSAVPVSAPSPGVPPREEFGGWLPWLAWPFHRLASGLSRAGTALRVGGPSLLAFAERPLVLALLIAVVAGCAGGLSTRLELPHWRWPWHWPTPTPPVPPKPPVPPVPPVPPAPIPAKGLHVLVVLESADLSKLPSKQAAALTAQEVRQYLIQTCPKGPDGKTPEYRILDKDVDLSSESKLWQDAFRLAQGKPLPYLIVSNPDKGGGYQGVLPADADALLALLKKYGG